MSDLDLTEAVEAAQDDLTRTLGKAVRAHRAEPAVDLAEGSTIFPHAIAQGLVELVAPLIEAVVRAKVAEEIRADAGRVEEAAAGWRQSAAHPVNTSGATDYDLRNAAAREAAAKHLRGLADHIAST